MIATKGLRFDAEKHLYFLHDRPIPGFSEIIKDLGFPSNPFWTAVGREEGTALHKWCLFVAQGKDPETEPDPRIAGRVEGFRKFLAETAFQFIDGEKPIYCHNPEFCCTPDMWGKIAKIRCLIEIKGGALSGTHRLQTAAQAAALYDNGFTVINRFCLYLKDSGYSLVPHKDRSDLTYWKSCADAWWAKRIYGKEKNIAN